jgi:hypothetical protein
LDINSNHGGRSSVVCGVCGGVVGSVFEVVIVN